MNECQVWWTITGNFGNMMPIDWSKSTARAKQLPTLNLCNPRDNNASKHNNKKADFVDGLEDEDDLVAADLDMHSLILSSNPQENAVCIFLIVLQVKVEYVGKVCLHYTQFVCLIDWTPSKREESGYLYCHWEFFLTSLADFVNTPYHAWGISTLFLGSPDSLVL